MTTRTSNPALARKLARSTALCAAMDPVTPSTIIFIPLILGDYHYCDGITTTHWRDTKHQTSPRDVASPQPGSAGILPAAGATFDGKLCRHLLLSGQTAAGILTSCVRK